MNEEEEWMRSIETEGSNRSDGGFGAYYIIKRLRRIERKLRKLEEKA